MLRLVFLYKVTGSLDRSHLGLQLERFIYPSCWHSLVTIMGDKNLEKNGGRVERKPLEAPKNLIEAVSMLTEAIVLLHSEKGTWHFFDLSRAILHAVMDKVFSNFYLFSYLNTSYFNIFYQHIFFISSFLSNNIYYYTYIFLSFITL